MQRWEPFSLDELTALYLAVGSKIMDLDAHIETEKDLDHKHQLDRSRTILKALYEQIDDAGQKRVAGKIIGGEESE
jgi:hypothetical protein